MSIYSKAVSDLSTPDLVELLQDLPVENVRLEFKSLLPSRDEFLKKVSGLGNTYGGLLVIGASETKDGKLESLPGIVPEAGVKQKLVQWSFDGLTPPLELFVSEPIPTPSDSSRVCFVVSVPESLVAPHFINGRKGAYVRTDEFSGRFEAQLATYDDIAHLADRRSLSIERRASLLKRGEARFSVFERNYDQEQGRSLDAVATFFVAPAYPSRVLVSQDRLFPLLTEAHGRWRSTGYPILGQPVSQHESAILLGPAARMSILEATTWGSLFYGMDIEEKVNGVSQIHIGRMLGTLLVSLAHAGRYYSKIGFDGLLWLRISIKRIYGMPLLVGSHPSVATGSPIDNQLEFDLTVSSDRLKNDINAVASDALRTICFALNWHEAADDFSLGALLSRGYEYNFWTSHGY